MPKSLRRSIPVMLGLALFSPRGSTAEVVRVEVVKRVDVLGGQAFGSYGAYELIEGRILFAFDPGNRYNARIVDLGRAPRTSAGLVEAWAEFTALRPKHPPANALALVEVTNRGGAWTLNEFNLATTSAHPSTAAELGDGLLMRLGLTVIWIGWQYDVPESPDLLGLEAPVALGDGGAAITGLVRSDWVVPRATKTLGLAHGNHTAYPVLDPDGADNVLTVRDGRDAPRQTVPRSEWRFAREAGDSVVPDGRSIYRTAGFEPGRIYELVYRAENPKVSGLSLAVVRDVISNAKHDPASPFAVSRGIAFGISQTGRFLRQFLYQGFNTDERGRKAYDGMFIQIAGGGRGSFNHRFAQPSRDAHRFDAFFYPTDLFPFTTKPETDPLTGRTDGLLAHLFDPAHAPLIFQVNGGYEYWGRAASLIHTSPDGRTDVAPVPNERIYHMAGAQHVSGPFPPPESARHPGSRAYRNQPMDNRLPMRALLSSFVAWVRDGVAPPPSAYPRLATGDLVPIDRLRLPAIPDLGRPTVVHEPDRLDFGPRWAEGIIDHEPPLLGPRFPVRVAQVDSLGNEKGGVRVVEIDAPLATYLPWNLRRGLPGDTTEMSRILGTYLALPRTEAERQAAHDPRPSIALLYGTKEAYLARADQAARHLIARRMLLPEDRQRAVERAGAHWEWLFPRR
ncbi:MAG: alpha/beta hydrolase domain-containing protein [Gemmatimonadota bacterium]